MLNSATYESPFSGRYSTERMKTLFSQQKRAGLFRRLWLALAEAEAELGLDIPKNAISEMKAHLDDINFEEIAKVETEVNHDVMAHIKVFGKLCPAAAPIIHLGATSCFVGDNADLLIYKEALEFLREKLQEIIKKMCAQAEKYKNTACLGYTHLQAAQPVTVGKRFTLWIQDFYGDLEDIGALLDGFKLRGARGTTGTEASFLQLFEGDGEKVDKMNALIAEKMGADGFFAVTGQTYPRKFDYKILSVLSGIAQSASKFANDVRLLQGLKEIEEPFEEKQIGSSAMAYKRNPMRSERICSLSRYLLTLPENAAITASVQWLERSLDDSANRRIVMSEGFLAADAILKLVENVAGGLAVNEKNIERRLAEELPFMATESILMACVKAGGDRQELHEKIRVHSMEGGAAELISRIKADKAFAAVHNSLDDMLKPENFVGRCAEQVEKFIKGLSKS